MEGLATRSVLQEVPRTGNNTVTVDLDDTPEGAIRLIFEAATISYQTLDFACLAQVPAYYKS